MKKAKLILLTVALTMLFSSLITYAAIQPSYQTNWDQSANATVEATGTGVPPENTASLAQARNLARRAAIVDAYRNLLEATQSIQVDSETTLQNLMIQNDTVKTKVSGMIQGAKIIREAPQADGSYQVTISLPLYGGTNSIAAIALPQVQPATLQPFPQPYAPNVMSNQTTPQYTGIIIDARGFDLQSTFSPAIYDETGRAIYGTNFINPDFAITYGMADYAPNQDLVDEALNGHSRAGTLPIVVKAISLKGNNCNIIISKADADQILVDNQANGFLQKCSVVFLK